MAASVDLLPELTCSLCHCVYYEPKILPNCAHSFCLQCLKNLPLTGQPPYQIILCPDCNTASVVVTEKGGVEAFATNLTVQRLAARYRPSPTPQPLALNFQSSFSTALLTDDYVHLNQDGCQVCDHCQKRFCGPCGARHLTTVKDEASDLLQKSCVKPNFDKVEEMLQADLDKIRSALDRQGHEILLALVRLVRERVVKATEDAERRVKAEADRYQDLSSSLQEQYSNLEQKLKDGFNKGNLELAKVSKFHSEVVQFEENSKRFQNLTDSRDQLVEVRLNETWQESLNEAFKSLELFGNLKSHIPSHSPHSSDVVATENDKYHVESEEKAESQKHMNLINVVEVPITKMAIRVASLTSLGLFAVLSVSEIKNRITIMNPLDGETIQTIDISTPRWNHPRGPGILAEHLAFDNDDSIFLTVKATDSSCSQQMAICRFWLSDVKDDSVMPDLFVMSHRSMLKNTFQSLAISEELKLVFTNDDEAVVAFASTLNRPGVFGQPLVRWPLGPDAIILAVDDVFNPSHTLKLYCSTRDRLWLWTIKPSASLACVNLNQIHRKKLPIVNESSNMCYDRDDCLFNCQSGELFRYVNLNMHPAVASRIPSRFAKRQETRVKHLAAFTYPPDDRTYLAVLYPSSDSVIAFAEVAE